MALSFLQIRSVFKPGMRIEIWRDGWFEARFRATIVGVGENYLFIRYPDDLGMRKFSVHEITGSHLKDLICYRLIG